MRAHPFLTCALVVIGIGAAAAAQHSTRRVVHHRNDLPASWRRCTTADDCSYVEPRCCGSCGVIRAQDVLAVDQRHEEAFHRQVCPRGGLCPRCTGVAEPGLDVACVHGTCEVALYRTPEAPRVDAPAGAPSSGWCLGSDWRIVPESYVPEGLRSCSVASDCTTVGTTRCPVCGVVGVGTIHPVNSASALRFHTHVVETSMQESHSCSDCNVSVDPDLAVTCSRNICQLITRTDPCGAGGIVDSGGMDATVTDGAH